MPREAIYTRPARLVLKPETYDAAERIAGELGMAPTTWMRWAIERQVMATDGDYSDLKRRLAKASE